MKVKRKILLTSILHAFVFDLTWWIITDINRQFSIFRSSTFEVQLIL